MSLIKQILTASSPLKALIEENLRIKKLNKTFKSFLNPNLAQHCRLVKIKEENGEMEAIVSVNNSTWATRLKYEIPDIIKNLNTQQEFKNLGKIKYAILEQEEKREIQNQKQQLSSENEQRWQEVRQKLKVYSKQSGIPARRTQGKHEEHTFCVCNECEPKCNNAGNPRSTSITKPQISE